MSHFDRMKKITLFLSLFFALKPAICQTPFICDGEPIIVSSQNFDFSTVYETEIDPAAGNVDFNEIAPLTGHHINAIGYRVTDNLIYGVDFYDTGIYRFDAVGNVEYLSPIITDSIYHYSAGDVTPDGRYLVLLGNHFSSDDRILLTVDLESGNYEQTVDSLTTISGTYIFCGDIAFHPMTGELYGYDAAFHRLVAIDPIAQLIDDVTFPVQYYVNHLPSLFFDPFGNLYGLGNNVITYPFAFFEVDHLTGTGRAIAPATELTGSTDGCSCPYVLALQQSFSPEEVFPCTETVVTFRVANLTGIIQEEISLEQEFENQTIIKEILYNPFGGDIGTSIGTNQLRIANMTVPIGIDSILVKIDVGELPAGIYDHQARLLGAELVNYGDTLILSDYPATLVPRDSTPLEIIPLILDLDNNQDYFCYGESIVIEASAGEGVFYLWNNGATTSSLEVNTPGQYSVTISTGCEILSDSIYVHQGGLILDLGQGQTIDLGDQIILDPFLTSFGNILTYRWVEIGESLMEVSCNSCKTLELTPINNVSFELHVEDEFGCTETDTVHIFVNKNYQVYVPNAFSPNDDGINDRFFPQTKHDTKIISFQVFDRWGNQVFSIKDTYTNDPQSGWDGFYKNKKLDAGVYVWSIDLEFLDGAVKKFTGDVLILK